MPDRLVSEIRLENVSFTYPGTEKPVLTDVSMNLPAGSVQKGADAPGADADGDRSRPDATAR